MLVFVTTSSSRINVCICNLLIIYFTLTCRAKITVKNMHKQYKIWYIIFFQRRQLCGLKQVETWMFGISGGRFLGYWHLLRYDLSKLGSVGTWSPLLSSLPWPYFWAQAWLQSRFNFTWFQFHMISNNSGLNQDPPSLFNTIRVSSKTSFVSICPKMEPKPVFPLWGIWLCITYKKFEKIICYLQVKWKAGDFCALNGKVSLLRKWLFIQLTRQA